jgi:hypothetical protein
MAYRQANTHFSGYGASYPYFPSMSGYAYQHDLYPGSSDLLSRPEDNFSNPSFHPMRGLASAARRPRQRRSTITPLPAPVPRMPAREQPLILSPSTPRASDSLMNKLLKTDSQDPPETLIVQASGGVCTVDKLVSPNAIPIGSAVHLQQSQKWGVVKIANASSSLEVIHSMWLTTL